jgi:hypothetical protein
MPLPSLRQFAEGMMCNACGFYCCAYDGFSKCGCDYCYEPQCWDESMDDSPEDDDDGYYETAPAPHRQFFCDSPSGTRHERGEAK